MKTTLLLSSLLFAAIVRGQTPTPQPTAASATGKPFSKPGIQTRWTPMQPGQRPSFLASSYGNVSASTNLALGRGKMAKQTLAPIPTGANGVSKSVVSTSILERGPHHRVMRTVVAQTNEMGEVAYRTNRYTELATGMHYFENGEWKETRELIEPAAGGAIAQYGPHKVIFAENLNTAGAIEMETSDAKLLQSHVLGLGYIDPASGKNVLIAELKDSLGEIVNSNQVVYADAFKGVKADVRYTYTKAGLEQDVILREQPPTPESCGLDSKTSRLQTITEFLSPPAPAKIATASATPGDGEDEALDFGAMQMGAGKAFAIGLTKSTEEKIPVAKHWTVIDGRTILFEEVPVSRIGKQLEGLPVKKRTAFLWNEQNKAAQQNASLKMKLPAPKAGKSSPHVMQMASVDTMAPGVVLDYLLISSAANFTFQGDTTYYASGQVQLSGVTTFEGGAVIKYAVNAALIIGAGSGGYGSTIVWKATAYHPVIFTAKDDVSVGDNVSTAALSGYYANPALDIQNVYNSGTIQNVRFAYAQQALTIGSSSYLSLSHAQFVNCRYGVGAGNYQAMTLYLKNALFSNVQTPFNLYSLYYMANISAQQVTFDSCATLVREGPNTYYPPYYSLNFVNCILANVAGTGWSGAVSSHLSGNNNGFYNGPQFGSSPSVETESPFAPTGFIDPITSIQYFYVVNGQGAYYLRNGSPFVDAGTPNIDASLKADLARTTTTAPELFEDAVNSSMTLSPTSIRDADTPDLGYHYPAIDYVVVAATINNATLNIDPGTVLAFTDPFGYWGIRLNPGGRLNVNGVPTNRVTFARLESVQESPIAWFQLGTPLITFKGIIIPGGPVVTPLVEAHLHYADFPTLSGPANYSIFPLFSDYTFHLISNLELDGCNFQGGWFEYESGGPANRNLTMRNTIFERSLIQMINAWDYDGDVGENLTLANNLFYHCAMELYPFNGDTWTFTDNIFDQVSFVWQGVTYNGPVAVNHHNAYVGMTDRLSPAAPTSTNPNIASLSYQIGSLGNFYLPSSASALIHKGSRTAPNAGLYHFTSLTSNTKEATSQVNIGPAYLALVNGKPADSNNDGVPDFLADRNGNGIEDVDEIPWMLGHYGLTVSILSPINGATLSGIARLQIDLGSNPMGVESVFPLVDGRPLHEANGVKKPGVSIGQIEIDTRYLENGTHTLVIGYRLEGSDGFHTEFSMPVSIATSNDIRQPSAERKAAEFVTIDLKVPASLPDYKIWFFGADYPYSLNPTPRSLAQGASGGVISYSEVPANLGFGDGNADPQIYSITEIDGAGQGAAVVNPEIRQPRPWGASDGPSTGWWATTYSDDPLEYSFGGRKADKFSYYVNPITLAGNDLWLHGVWLNSGWRLCGTMSSAGSQPSVVYLPTIPTSRSPQTWPVRLWPYDRLSPDEPEGPQPQDVLKLLQLIANPAVRNFYGCGHGSPTDFLQTDVGVYSAVIQHRYRFAFIDGCYTGSGNLLEAFGATSRELATPAYPVSDAPLPPLVGIDINYYNSTGFRPGAFLGWKTTPVVGWGLADEIPYYDDLTGKPNCKTVCYPALCNWHVQFLFSWFNGRTLLQAITDANNLAFSPFSTPAPRFELITSVPIPQADGTAPYDYFKPETCLRVYGYGDLKFNEYNHAGDWVR